MTHNLPGLPDPHQFANQLAEAIALINQMIAPVDEAALGYRRTLEEQGWSPTAAEEMALNYHGLLMNQLKGSS